MYEDVALEYVGKIKDLLLGEPFSFRDLGSANLRDKPGVYVIFNERNEVIYVGRTRNLRRRLLHDHRRGNVRGSQFRKALMQNYGLKNEDEISNYIDQKCTFKFKEIEEPIERINKAWLEYNP
ncbi:MAG: GIY-YIG nuclease family protein [Candidatus Bathyarchaeia archaeon]